MMNKITALETTKAIALVREGGEWDARKLQLAIAEWRSDHEVKDWHEFSDLLGLMETYGMVKYVGVSNLGLAKFVWVK